MISTGCSVEKQKAFVVDACLFNKRARAQILRRVKAINAELVISIPPARAPVKRPCSPLPDDIFMQAKAQLDEIEAHGDTWLRLRFGASLLAPIRNRLFSKQDIESIRNMRASALRASSVMKLLNCSLAELNVLDKGELQHCFTRNIDIKGKKVPARYWLAADVSTYQTLRAR